MSERPRFSRIVMAPAALGEVMGRLDQLSKHSGRMRADKLWLNDGEQRSLTITQLASADGSSPAVINTTFRSLQRMKQMRATLNSLTKSLKEVISKVQTHTRPALRHHGIKSVPAEILSRIFEFACDPRTSDGRRVSQVCRRFRDLALGIPRLWTYITPQQTVDWQNLQIARSGNSPLIVDFSARGRRMQPHWYPSFHDPCTCMGYLAFATKHSRRWKEFTFAVTHQGPTDGPVKTQVHALLAGLFLPSLECLTVGSGIFTEDVMVVRTWRTPRLKHLRCSQELWPLLETVATSITHLNLLIQDFFLSSASEDVVYFLCHPKVSGIEVLYVTNAVRMLTSISLANAITPSCFHDLRSLTLDFYSPNNAIFDILLDTKFPKLETITLKNNMSIGGDDAVPFEYGSEHEWAMWERVQQLMEIYFVGFCHWLDLPLPEFRDQFPSLKLIKIHIDGHDRAEERALDVELKDRLCNGWQGEDSEHDTFDFYDIIPEIDITFNARPLWGQTYNGVSWIAM